jgi:hypothetical protein
MITKITCPSARTTAQPNFGYSHKLKTDFKKGRLPSVKFDVAGIELNNKNVTLDHVIPKSQGGKSNLFNYMLASEVFNSFRGVVPLAKLITKKMFDKWAKQFEGIMVCGVEGEVYTEEIRRKIWEA